MYENKNAAKRLSRINENVGVSDYKNICRKNFTCYCNSVNINGYMNIIISGFVLIFKVDQDVVVNANGTINSPSNLVELFTHLNNSNISVECPDNFKLNASQCILEIPYCDRWYPAGQASITILNVGLSMLVLFGFVISVISIVSFLMVRFSETEKHSPLKKRLTDLFDNLLICLQLCIFLFLIFDLAPIPNSTYCKQFNNSGIYNALFQLYVRIHGVLSIQFIVSIALPLFLVCVPLALWEGKPYQAYINIRLIAIKPDTNSLSSLLIYYSPLMLLTVAPILLCKFGWNKISLNFAKPKSEKSFLESRIIIYSVSVLLIMIFLTICLIQYTPLNRATG